MDTKLMKSIKTDYKTVNQTMKIMHDINLSESLNESLTDGDVIWNNKIMKPCPYCGTKFGYVSGTSWNYGCTNKKCPEQPNTYDLCGIHKDVILFWDEVQAEAETIKQQKRKDLEKLTTIVHTFYQENLDIILETFFDPELVRFMKKIVKKKILEDNSEWVNSYLEDHFRSRTKRSYSICQTYAYQFIKRFCMPTNGERLNHQMKEM